VDEVLSPLADKRQFGGSMIDYNVRAERMGWLPSAPQLKTNPLQVCRDASAAAWTRRTTWWSRSRTARCK
jgi:nitrate reductase alpha subunit